MNALRTGPAQLALGLVLAIGLTACAAPQATAPAPAESKGDVASVPIGDKTVVEGGDLVMALSADPDRLDPTTSSTLLSRIVLQSACEKLYALDTEGEIEPVLATGMPEVSDDGLTVTIPVRDDATFADGTHFDAGAVVTSLQRHFSHPASARRSELGPITGITALDDTHVQITYSAPFSPLITALIAGAGVVMSPTALKEYGDNFGDHPVCVGPFKFVKRIPQTSITFERDPLYYAADQIHLNTITYKIMNDSTLRATNLRSGDVQVADVISTQDVDDLIAADDVDVLRVGSLGFQHLNVNLGNAGPGKPLKTMDTPLATEPAVRMALSMSIDRQALVNSVFAGWFEPTCSPIPVVSGLSTPESDACPTYDPQGAKALLEQAGVPTPYPLELHVPNFPDNVRLAQALQAMVTAGGFAMTVVPVEPSTLNTDSINGNYALEQQSWSGRMDPNGNMFNFLSTGGGFNRTGYSNPDVDRLMKEAVLIADPTERAAMYGKVMQQIHQDNPMIFLYRIRNLTGYNTKVAGIETSVDGVIDLTRAAFVE